MNIHFPLSNQVKIKFLNLWISGCGQMLFNTLNLFSKSAPTCAVSIEREWDSLLAFQYHHTIISDHTNISGKPFYKLGFQDDWIFLTACTFKNNRNLLGYNSSIYILDPFESMCVNRGALVVALTRCSCICTLSCDVDIDTAWCALAMHFLH